MIRRALCSHHHLEVSSILIEYQRDANRAFIIFRDRFQSLRW